MSGIRIQMLFSACTRDREREKPHFEAVYTHIAASIRISLLLGLWYRHKTAFHTDLMTSRSQGTFLQLKGQVNGLEQLLWSLLNWYCTALG